MNKSKEKTHFIGVDISKDTLDLALYVEASYPNFIDLKVTNEIKGFKQIIKWLKSHKIALNDCFICMEHTGTYGLLLLAWLNHLEVEACVEPGLHIKRSLGLTRGKNDKIDARRIADYAFCHRTKLKPFKIPSQLVLKIKQLLTYREQQVKIRSSLKNSRKSHQQYNALTKQDDITKLIDRQIKGLDKIILNVEQQIKTLIKQDTSVKKNADLVESVKGIGLVTAAFMLVTTNNFTSFENGRKYACYCGIAPFEHQSGSSIKGRTKVSHMGNKHLKKILANGANSASMYDKELRAYYQRKLKEGKDHKLIINAICCKLVNRAFAVVKRQTPFVEIYQHGLSK